MADVTLPLDTRFLGISTTQHVNGFKVNVFWFCIPSVGLYYCVGGQGKSDIALLSPCSQLIPHRCQFPPADAFFSQEQYFTMQGRYGKVFDVQSMDTGDALGTYVCRYTLLPLLMMS